MTFEGRAPYEIAADAGDVTGEDHYCAARAEQPINPRPSKGRALRGVASRIDRVRVHSFLYTDAPNGTYVRCGLRIVPGAFSICQDLAGHPVLGSAGKRDAERPSFPWAQIVFDGMEPRELQTTEAVPASLLTQIQQLPHSVLAGLEVRLVSDFVILKLAFPAKLEARIILRRQVPHAPLAVRVSRADVGNPVVVEREILSKLFARQLDGLVSLIAALLRVGEPRDEGMQCSMAERGVQNEENAQARCAAKDGDQPELSEESTDIGVMTSRTGNRK